MAERDSWSAVGGLYAIGDKEIGDERGRASVGRLYRVSLW